MQKTPEILKRQRLNIGIQTVLELCRPRAFWRGHSGKELILTCRDRTRYIKANFDALLAAELK
jgi:hypothetical protein